MNVWAALVLPRALIAEERLPTSLSFSSKWKRQGGS